MTSALTIRQAAAFAGAMVQTVRHHHRLGLVDQPARDVSGRRRYASAELPRPAQVRTVAGAGPTYEE
ncbi:MerR family DNA-binding transcriptional regulator [Nonomuraea sp. NPDC052129]|uniref:MerR family DNA-binding transcriptional regulator n=1 Tax=Nonomuraea sp. NPDC052129 TaxID=3154651 RepID=UPI003414C752